jgi:hypothetical protein
MTTPEPSLGWAAIDWIEHYLVHGPGDVQGQPIELDDEFATFIVKAYAVDPKTGERCVRRAFLSRAKGRSKSGLAAMIECFEALGPCRFSHWAEAGEISDWGYEYEEGEPVGKPLPYVEALNVATEESQAGNTYDAVYYMLNPDTCSPELLDDFGTIDVGLGRINLPDKRGYIEPVTSADSSKDGGKSTFIVADETHLWVLPRLHRLHGIMTRNLLKRKAASGWMLETSTMYAEGENSVAEGTHNYAQSSSSSRKFLLFDHRQADMKWDLEDRSQRIKALRQAYGPASAWMNLPAIADSWDDPQVSEASFRRFWLNQPVALIEAPASIFPTWAQLVGDTDLDIVSFGIAADLAANRYVLGGCVGVYVDIITPAAFAGPQVPAAQRALFVSEVARIAGRNPVGVQEKGPAWPLVPDLEDAGVNVQPIGMDGFVQACADFEAAVLDGSLRHGGQDELNAAVTSAAWRTVGDRRVISRKKADIPELEAAIIARHVEAEASNYDIAASIY